MPLGVGGGRVGRHDDVCILAKKIDQPENSAHNDAFLNRLVDNCC